jgi:hypothetical protein
MGTSTTRRRTTFASVVVRVLVTRLAVFGAAAAVVALGHLMAPISSSSSPAEPSARELPSWTVSDSAAYPDCVPFASWPTGRPAAALVVYSFRDHAERLLPFDVAWAANHNVTEVDDVWVVGVCDRHPLEKYSTFN